MVLRCFKQRSLRCQYGRLQKGRGERYLLHLLGGLQVCVWDPYRVGESEGILISAEINAQYEDAESNIFGDVGGASGGGA